MRVPVEFSEVLAVGDQAAGGRIWRYGDGEVGLWWTPGAAEDLLLDSALVALEATYAADERFSEVPQPSEVIEDRWQDFPVFEFPELWPGADGGPAVAWVIQGPDDWLYVLRVRSVGGTDVPQLHRRVASTFAIEGGAD